MRQIKAGMMINKKFYERQKEVDNNLIPEQITTNDFREIAEALNSEVLDESKFSVLSREIYENQLKFLELQKRNEDLEFMLNRYKEVYPDIDFEMSDSPAQLRATIQNRNKDIDLMKAYLKTFQNNLNNPTL